MKRWLDGNNKRSKEPEVFDSVAEGLQSIYRMKLLPLEEHYKFHDFHSPQLDDPDFDAKPMILLIGQYSTGKTTFIRYLIVKLSSTELLNVEHWNLFRNAFPNLVNGLNCFLLSTTRAFPGTTPS
jgi:uncharacterized FlgJ-related protein